MGELTAASEHRPLTSSYRLMYTAVSQSLQPCLHLTLLEYRIAHRGLS